MSRRKSLPKKPKLARISVRISVELQERLRAALAKCTPGTSEAQLIEACAEAACDFIEKHEQITFPLVVRPKNPAPVYEISSEAIASTVVEDKSRPKGKGLSFKSPPPPPPAPSL